MVQSSKLKMSTSSKVALGVVFLMLGCVIYLLFRSKTLNIYQWCSSLGLAKIIDYARFCVYDWSLPDFVKYSLPDGLYCAAYILFIDAIWQDNNNLIKHIVIAIVPIVTISTEILQYYGLVKGTFDSYDLLFYSIPIIVYYFNKYHSIQV